MLNNNIVNGNHKTASQLVSSVVLHVEWELKNLIYLHPKIYFEKRQINQKILLISELYIYIELFRNATVLH